MQFLSSGKVKDIYDLNDGTLVFRFSDRVSAYDVEFIQAYPMRYWFSNLSTFIDLNRPQMVWSCNL